MRILYLGLALLVVAWMLHGCVPQPPKQVQKPVTIMPEPPPAAPSAVELEKPPNIVLEKPERDPFIALKGEGTFTGKMPKGAPTSGNFVVSGVIYDHKSSAILEAGTNSYIVHPGDRVGGYSVSSITPRQVVLTKGRTRVVLPVLGGH